MTTLTTYALPIYQAVVCNLTLEKLKQEENVHKDYAELLGKLVQCLKSSRIVIEILTKTDFAAAPKDSIGSISVALSTLVLTGRHGREVIRRELPDVPEQYRTAISTVFSDFEENVVFIEEIAEAWAMAYDELTSSEIRQALSDSNKKKEIPEWRAALAAVSD
jgi:hypothetical protein